MKVIVGISGASLANLGIKTANVLNELKCEVCVIFSQNAKISLACESLNINMRTNLSPCELIKKADEFIAKSLNAQIKVQNEIYHSAASGSSGYDAMLIAPCSTNALAKIACGISDNLLTRAAAVMLKERRKLILGVREMPLSPISLKQMSTLAKLGVIIAPPILASYSDAKNLNEIENFIIGKWLDVLGIQNNLYKRWK